MKEINFIKTVSPQKQRAIRKWFIISTVLLSILFLIMITFNIPQLITIFRIKKEYTVLQQQVNATHALLAQSQQLQKKFCCLDGQCAKLNAFACAPEQPRTYINNIIQACKDPIKILSCSLYEKKVEIKAACSNAQQATACLQQLASKPEFSKLKIVSLEPTTQAQYNVFFTIKGTII